MDSQKELVDLPIAREVKYAGDPHGYGWVRITHTILHAGPISAQFYPKMED